MAIYSFEKIRSVLGQRVRLLRQDRRWTQTALAKLLGLSQNRLSEIEHGNGSFSAEQLITLLHTFNVPLDELVTLEHPVDELQNALARLGATHLAESSKSLPTERLREALAAIRETLAVADSPRQTTALAPVLVNHAESLNLAKLSSDLGEIGLSGRLGWAVENTIWALKEEINSKKLHPRWFIRYRRALVVLEQFLSYFSAGAADIASPKEDIFDAGIGSAESLKEAKKERSKISRDWHIVTRIQPEDFRQALEAARDLD